MIQHSKLIVWMFITGPDMGIRETPDCPGTRSLPFPQLPLLALVPRVHPVYRGSFPSTRVDFVSLHIRPTDPEISGQPNSHVFDHGRVRVFSPLPPRFAISRMALPLNVRDISLPSPRASDEFPD
jgi:hypothetical protein